MKKVSRSFIIMVLAVAWTGTSHASAESRSLRQVAILAKANQPAKALKLLNEISQAKNSNIAGDILAMTKGRVYFQLGLLDKAYEAYDSVPKSSDLWLESVEERAHVMGRKGDYAKAIALLQTVVAAPFDSIVGPEPYFVLAITDLKICDYAAIFKVTKDYKERFQPRVSILTALSRSGDGEAVRRLLNRLVTQPLNFDTVGNLAKDLPRGLERDNVIYSESRKNDKTTAAVSIRRRVSELARQELKEIEDITNKLQIIEAEVIQRIHLAEKSKANREKQGSIASGSDVLTFPASDEVWMDELDHYQAQVEKCPAPTRRAQL